MPDWIAHYNPWPHWTRDRLADPIRCRRAAGDALADLYDRPGGGWVTYANELERKHASTAAARLPAVAPLLDLLTGPEFVAELAGLTGVPGLYADPTLHGGGVHVVPPGGLLAPHLDYARHPHLTDAERRVNLLLFLTDADPHAGGAFELYADDGATCVTRVYPAAGRAVVWCPGDVEYHGTQAVAADAPPRAALAVYYLAPARPTAVRKRALFVPRRG